MPGPAIAAVAGAVGSAAIQSKAAKSAASSQSKAANAQIEESRRQFDLIQGLLKPYVSAGTSALQAQLDLMGIGGTAGGIPGVTAIPANKWSPAQWKVGERTFSSEADANAFAETQRTEAVSAGDAQAAAIQGLEQGSQFGALVKQGEYGLLANQAATGGLRGGDTQAALGQFRPQMLQALIDRQLANYGGVAASGQNAAGMTGTAAQNTGAQVNQALGDRGAAQAGGALASGQAWANAGAGVLNGLGGMSGFGGGGVNGNGAWANGLFGGSGLGNLF